MRLCRARRARTAEGATGSAWGTGRSSGRDLGLVRRRTTSGGVELRGSGSSCCFGPAVIVVGEGRVSAPSRSGGGLLVRRPVGRSARAEGRAGAPLDGHRIPPGPRRPTLYIQVQRRFHLAVSRRYFGRLVQSVTVVVFGATGMVGRALLPALAEHDVGPVSRRPRSGGWAVADATDPASVRRALEHADAVYYLVHSLGSQGFRTRPPGGGDGRPRGRARRRSAARLSRWARRRRRRISRSTCGAVGTPRWRWRAAPFGDDAARGGGRRRRQRGFETIVALVDRLPADGDAALGLDQTQPIAVADVVRYLAGVLRRPEGRARSFDVGGPEVMTYREMIERIARLRGKRPLLVEVPVLTPWLSSYWLHLVTPVKGGVARPLVEGLRNRPSPTTSRSAQLVPFELTPFDTAAREALVATERRG